MKACGLIGASTLPCRNLYCIYNAYIISNQLSNLEALVPTEIVKKINAYTYTCMFCMTECKIKKKQQKVILLSVAMEAR